MMMTKKMTTMEVLSKISSTTRYNLRRTRVLQLRWPSHAISLTMQEIVQHKKKKRKTRIDDDEKELDVDDLDLLVENLGQDAKVLKNKDYKRLKINRTSDAEGIFWFGPLISLSAQYERFYRGRT